MIYILLNLAPILAATLLALAIDYVHHRLIGRAERRLSAGMIATAVLSKFWFAAILAGALILAPPRADPWIMATASAVVIWAGFVLPVLATTLSYRRVSAGTVARDCGHWLIVMIAQAVVMKAIGLVPPPIG